MTDVMLQLRELEIRRNNMMRMRIRIENQTLAFIRQMIGFSALDGEGDREKLCAEAKRIKKAISGGQVVPDAHVYRAATIAPFVQISDMSVEPIESELKVIEKAMAKAAKALPVAEWWCSIRGLNIGGLSRIVANTGDLSNYANPGKVWKRMGLHVYKNRAPASWKSGGLTNQEWVDCGYSPSRRSVMFQVGDPIIKAGGPYKQVYIDRKRFEFEKAQAEGLTVATSAKATVASWEAAGLPAPTHVKKINPELHRSCGHINNRAQRYMEKRVLRDLWREWTGREPIDAHAVIACRPADAEPCTAKASD